MSLAAPGDHGLMLFRPTRSVLMARAFASLLGQTRTARSRQAPLPTPSNRLDPQAVSNSLVTVRPGLSHPDLESACR